jgi:hypothetical protein
MSDLTLDLVVDELLKLDPQIRTMIAKSLIDDVTCQYYLWLALGSIGNMEVHHKSP